MVMKKERVILSLKAKASLRDIVIIHTHRHPKKRQSI